MKGRGHHTYVMPYRSSLFDHFRTRVPRISVRQCFNALSWSLFILVLACGPVLAQTATDACSYGGTAYTVNTSCTFQNFNKPNAFTANYNPGTCNAGNYDDAYGWFQATSTTTNITYDPLNNHDAVLHVF